MNSFRPRSKRRTRRSRGVGEACESTRPLSNVSQLLPGESTTDFSLPASLPLWSRYFWALRGPLFTDGREIPSQQPDSVTLTQNRR